MSRSLTANLQGGIEKSQQRKQQKQNPKIWLQPMPIVKPQILSYAPSSARVY